MQRGIFYTMEAIIALALLLAIILAASFGQQNGKHQAELYIIQKQNDLLKARIIERNFSLTEMAADFQLLFPGKSGFVELNNALAKFGKKCNNGTASEAKFFSLTGKNSMRVLVCTD